MKEVASMTWRHIDGSVAGAMALIKTEPLLLTGSERVNDFGTGSIQSLSPFS